jgi:hypothetical protein
MKVNRKSKSWGALAADTVRRLARSWAPETTQKQGQTEEILFGETSNRYLSTRPAVKPKFD